MRQRLKCGLKLRKVNCLTISLNRKRPAAHRPIRDAIYIALSEYSSINEEFIHLI